MNKNQENNNFVYQHVTPDGKYYFGATNNLEQRWGSNGKNYKGTSLWPEIEKWGWDNIQHQVLFENQSRENALWIEDFLITTAQEDGVCINKNRSGHITGHTTEDWNEYQNDYIHKNSDRKQKWNRDYYVTHKSYHRTYYIRKKYNKQLNELGYIPLF